MSRHFLSVHLLYYRIPLPTCAAEYLCSVNGKNQFYVLITLIWNYKGLSLWRINFIRACVRITGTCFHLTDQSDNIVTEILGNCPTWCTNSFQYIYLFIVPYMFRACHSHHQEKKIVSIHLLVIVTPCWWLCRVLVGSKLD